jgi:hypothetical protein
MRRESRLVSGSAIVPPSTDLNHLAAFGQGIGLFAELFLKKRQQGQVPRNVDSASAPVSEDRRESAFYWAP